MRWIGLLSNSESYLPNDVFVSARSCMINLFEAVVHGPQARNNPMSAGTTHELIMWNLTRKQTRVHCENLLGRGDSLTRNNSATLRAY